MRIGFFLREAVRATRRSSASSFAALATVLVTMLMLGVFIPIVQATNGAANTVRSRVEVDVYFKAGATKADEARVHRKIAALPHVKRIAFVSKAEALAQQQKTDPAAYKLLGTNPLPDTFQVIPTDPKYVLSIRDALTPTGTSGTATFDPSIQTVSNKKTDTKKILHVMKLVGAPDWFIRWPFVIEGIVVGAAGAALALVVLALTKVFVLDPLASSWTLIATPKTISFIALVGVLMGAGVLVSAVGSGLSLRRFLRV